MEDALKGCDASGCVGTCVLGVEFGTRELLTLSDATAPIVVADQSSTEWVVPSVAFDNDGAGRLVAEHLIGLGHRRLAVVACAQRMTAPKRDRLRGVESYALGAGARIVCRMLYNNGESAHALRSVLRDPARPTAVVCMSGTQVELLNELAAKEGKRVPEDLSAVTFGESRLARTHHITMAHMDNIALGAAALEAILDDELVDDPRAVLLPVKMSLGETTAAPSAE